MRDQSRREAAHETEEAEIETEEAVESSSTRFAGGNAPPVGGASTLAYEEDANERELKEKVGALVDKKFGGDFKAAFSHYDADKDGGMGKGEIVKLLSDAGVGNGLTRGVWASKILEKLDMSQDTRIQWGEFETVFRARA